jgi:hypothetical protein
MLDVIFIFSFILAQAESGMSFSDFTRIIEIGITGLILVLIITGKLAPGWVIEDNRKTNETLMRENVKMREAMEQKVIPALERATLALEKHVKD